MRGRVYKGYAQSLELRVSLITSIHAIHIIHTIPLQEDAETDEGVAKNFLGVGVLIPRELDPAVDEVALGALGPVIASIWGNR